MVPSFKSSSASIGPPTPPLVSSAIVNSTSFMTLSSSKLHDFILEAGGVIKSLSLEPYLLKTSIFPKPHGSLVQGKVGCVMDNLPSLRITAVQAKATEPLREETKSPVLSIPLPANARADTTLG